MMGKGALRSKHKEVREYRCVEVISILLHDASGEVEMCNHYENDHQLRIK